MGAFDYQAIGLVLYSFICGYPIRLVYVFMLEYCTIEYRVFEVFVVGGVGLETEVSDSRLEDISPVYFSIKI